jgi:Uma2 family endonuclease
VRGISGGVHLPEGGDYAPDAFVVERAAWDALAAEDQDRAYVPVLPVAAFELISPANVTATGFRQEFAVKLEAYERSAVPLVVLLHPKTESATLRRAGRTEEISTARRLRFDELTGLELDVAKIYAASRRNS